MSMELLSQPWIVILNICGLFILVALTVLIIIFIWLKIEELLNS